MYKVLLADDERIVREGVSRLVHWEQLGLELAAVAEDGLDACRKAQELRPDIIITDIRMPGMDGLKLVEQVSVQLPEAKFVILSGYGEFDFANRAMSYGIRHYLLKPCDEQEVENVLRQVTQELDEERQARAFISKTVDQLHDAIPFVKEAFFRDAVLANFYDRDGMNNFKSLFEIEEDSFNLVILVPDGKTDYVSKFSLKKIAEELLGGERVLISTVMQEEVCLLLPACPIEKIICGIQQTREYYQRYFGVTLSASVSEAGGFDELGAMYVQAQYCLSQRFYLGGNAIILQSDLPRQQDTSAFSFDSKPLLAAIEGGDLEALDKNLELFFNRMAQQHLFEQEMFSRCIELLVELGRGGRLEELPGCIGQLLRLQETQNLVQLRAQLGKILHMLAERNLHRAQERRNSLVCRVIECVENSLSNPELSLGWIAGQILYVNSDYLGRLFYRETGEYFSQYLLRCRMERAKELIEKSAENLKIYEISEKVGIAENPQYFSQLFKKYTGMTPTAYQKRCRGEKS